MSGLQFKKIQKISKRISALFVAVVLCFASSSTAYADPEETLAEETAEGDYWPGFPAELRAVSACVIDADTGEVLYGKDEHAKRYPASVTKILTALIVCEHCSLSEEVTFSESATTNLESGAVTIGAAVGDVLTVEDCLYALLLKSANEVANALAEHVSGSVEEFCRLMNEKAAELGCLSSDFHNPNGLTNEKHVTSAYDMALIAAACMNNSVFMEIEKSTTCKLPATAMYPDGLTVSMGHKMLHEEETVYDGRVVAGKTGFTSASGNTLVTMAEDGGRRVAAVVLKDSNPEHYADTRVLLDYAFDSFENVSYSPLEMTAAFPIGEDLLREGILSEGDYEISLAKSLTLTVPKDCDRSRITLSYDPELPEDAPELAKATVRLSYGGRTGTSAYVFVRDLSLVPETEPEENTDESETEKASEESGTESSEPFSLNVKVILVAMGVFFVSGTAAIFLYFIIRRKKEEKARLERIRKRRAERLKDFKAVKEETAEEQFSDELEEELSETEEKFSEP